MQRVLVISAHADDETLGCAGTLLKHAAQGDRLSWIIATAPWQPRYSADFIETWKSQVETVAAALGMAKTLHLGLPTTRLDAQPLADVISSMSDAIQEVAPDIVYVVHHGDVHSDHRVVFEAAYSAAKPMQRRNGTREILCYETLSSTNMAAPVAAKVFLPQVYVDISDLIERKLEIAKAYRTEMHDPPHPRALDAVRALARWRGAAVGVMFAEAFAVVRRVW